MDNFYTCNEDLEAQREREAGRTFSAFCLRENGDSRYLVTETPIEFLNAAHLLRLCLQDGYADATAYARRIPGGCASSREQFEKLLQARLDNTGRAAGVFELDFDRQVCSPPSKSRTAGKATGSETSRLPPARRSVRKPARRTCGWKSSWPGWRGMP